MSNVQAIRGATSAEENTITAMREVVSELLNEIKIRNQLNSEDVVSIIFTVTPDLDVIFPAAIARENPVWANIPLLDVQQMQVKGSLPKCIRVMMYINTEKKQSEIHHVYLRKAKKLRPDLSVTSE